MTDAGLENCEGIISIENDVRKKRKDIFYNTTVGTWASPFWLRERCSVASGRRLRQDRRWR